MARIVGGIGSSHTPTIGFALDTHKQRDPVWAPIFEGFRPVQRWLLEKRPDVLFFIYNDHVTSFFFDHYSHFALGVGEEYAVADEGGGPRNLPPVKGHAGLARHIATSLTADEFDLSYFQAKPLDHGCFSPLSVMWPHENGWPGAIVPLQVGVLEFPIPTARRCLRLGRSLRRAIESYPEPLRIAVLGTGGLSHSIGESTMGWIDEEFDHNCIKHFEDGQEERLAAFLTHALPRTGNGAHEIRDWVIAHAAAGSKGFELIDYFPSPETLVGAGFASWTVGK